MPIILTSQYWDCECEHAYINPRSLDECPICHARKDEQPDARLNEVRAHGLPYRESETYYI